MGRINQGLSEQSKQLRWHLLNENAPDVMKWMQGSGKADPVGMIVKMTDDIGKQLAYAAAENQGMPRQEIPRLIAFYCKIGLPDDQLCRQLRDHKKILTILSEPALQNLTASRKPSVHWGAIVGG